MDNVAVTAPAPIRVNHVHSISMDEVRIAALNAAVQLEDTTNEETIIRRAKRFADYLRTGR